MEAVSTKGACRRARVGLLAGMAWLAGAGASWGQYSFSTKTLAEGLQQPHGVAVDPRNGDVYVSEMGSGRIAAIRNGRAEPALAAGWTVAEDLPRWAIAEDMPLEKWMAGTLTKPGPISISSNGTLYVAEQVPNGRILEFRPDEQGKYSRAKAIPVPWLDQKFQWRDLHVDGFGRLFIAGADEVGSDFMKFGSCLVRQTDGDWWVIDFGPFAYFSTFALSEKQDLMLLGDRRQGTLSWWEVERHIMLGGSPNAAGKSELASLAVYPDGAFVLGQQDGPGKASLVRMDPFSGQQTTLSAGFQSIGDIAMDRANARFLVTDPAAGRVVECTPSPALRFNEAAMRQIVRSVDGMLGVTTEAPAFLNTFFERLQSATSELLEDDATHATKFNLSDIAGKMPVVAGRIRATVEVEGAEEDPVEVVEFFLLFPNMVVMTDTAVSPSLSFFSARRKSGKVEQTRSVFEGQVGVYRLSGTNVSRVASAVGGLYVPVTTCGIVKEENGVRVNLSFMGAGIYGDYYLSLFQGPREQSARLVVKSASTASGLIAYEATFMDEALIEGKDGTVTREQLSNLLVAGFEGSKGVNRSVGWMRLGKFPAAMTVAFGDSGDTTLTGAQSEMRGVIEQRRLEMSLESAEEIEAIEEPEAGEEDGATEEEAPPAEGAAAGEGDATQ